MFGAKVATKTEATKNAYMYRARLLFRRFQRETGVGALDRPHDFQSWFEKLKPNLSASTIRGYLAAQRYALKQVGLREFHDLVANIDSKGARPKASKLKASELRTSQKKRRGVPRNDLERLMSGIAKKHKTGYWLNIGIHVFVSTYFTGLRPIEWHSAEVRRIDNQLWLRVRNAKQGNGRTHGAYRHVSLYQFQDEIVDIIKATTKMCAASLDAHGRWLPPEKFRAKLSAAFSKYSRTVLYGRKRTIPIYCARHQFCANLKKAGYTRSAIAALMGHASDETAFRHYLHGRWGHSGGPLPVAVAEEAARVRQVAKPNPHTLKASAKGASRSMADRPSSSDPQMLMPKP